MFFLYLAHRLIAHILDPAVEHGGLVEHRGDVSRVREVEVGRAVLAPSAAAAACGRAAAAAADDRVVAVAVLLGGLGRAGVVQLVEVGLDALVPVAVAPY